MSGMWLLLLFSATVVEQVWQVCTYGTKHAGDVRWHLNKKLYTYIHRKKWQKKNSLIKTPFIHNFSHSYLPTYLRVNTDITSSFIKLLWLLFVYNLHIFSCFVVHPRNDVATSQLTVKSIKFNTFTHSSSVVSLSVYWIFIELSVGWQLKRLINNGGRLTDWLPEWLRTTEQQPPYHCLVRHKGTTAFVSHSVCLASRRIATLYWHRKRFICTFLNRANENKNIYLKYCRCCLIKT